MKSLAIVVPVQSPSGGKSRLGDVLHANKRYELSWSRRLNKATVQVLSQPDVRERLSTQLAIVVGGSSEQFKAAISQDFERQHRAVHAFGIKMD